MKLQKLIYFAHGWFLALTEKPFIDEHPEAWNYGPVIPRVYHEFKSFGRSSITRRATTLHGIDLRKAEISEPKLPDDPDVEKFLERIWEVYGGMSGVQLSNMTHIGDSAWDKAHKGAAGRKNVDISDEFIKAEFDEKKTRGRPAA